MRISPNFIKNLYPDTVNTQINDHPPTPSLQTGPEQNYDKVTIHAQDISVAERNFAEKLGKIIASEVNSTASPEKLDSLQQKIENGSYHVDVEAVAAKIMLQNGGKNHE